jgi:hypothetical protein
MNQASMRACEASYGVTFLLLKDSLLYYLRVKLV